MATHAFGTTLTWNSQLVAELTAVNGIELSIESVEKTTHDSPDFYREFHPGLIDPGEVAIEGFFKQTDTNGQVAMVTDAGARTTRDGVITFPASTGSTWSFSGFITAIKVGDAPIDGNIPFTATIKITGKPTFAVSYVTGASAVEISGAGTVIAPTFAVGVYDYVVDVANAVSSVTFTVTSTETITLGYDGLTQSLATTVASSAVSLSAGAIKTFTVTISDTGKASKVYTFRVVRAAS